MTVLRVAFPALVGAALIAVGVQMLLTSLQVPSGIPQVDAMRAAIPPLSIGAALLLVALAIARRIRVGWLLGLVVAALFAVAGLGIVVYEVPYLGLGGLNGAIVAVVVTIAGTWTLLALGYGLTLWRGRGTFASSWQVDDRWIAAGLAAVIFAWGGATVALRTVADQVVVEVESDQAIADALVRATFLDVRVIDATFVDAPESGSGPDQRPLAVEHLVLELMLRSPESYPLQTAPTLCLVDVATAQHEAYKPGVFCWGALGAVALEAGFIDLVVPEGMSTFRVELDRAASGCEFGAGDWIAELVLAPLVRGGGVGELSELPQPSTLVATFGIEPGPPGSAQTPDPARPTFAPCTGPSTARW